MKTRVKTQEKATSKGVVSKPETTRLATPRARLVNESARRQGTEIHSAATPSDVAHCLEQAVTAPPRSLPQRHALEKGFGFSLAHIRVQHNPAAELALDALHAEAAVYRGQILLSKNPSLLTLAHEVAHVLQADNAGRTIVPLMQTAPPAAEAEAESLATCAAHRAAAPSGADHFAPLTPAVALPQGAVALRRSSLAAPAPAPVSPAPAPAPATPAPASTQRTTPAEAPAPTPATATPSGRAQAAPAGEAAALPVQPAPPAPGVTEEQVAARAAQIAAAQASLDSADSSTGLMDAFAAAPPTIKAQMAGELGDRFNGTLTQETQQLQQDTPNVEAEMNGNTPAEAGVINAPTATDIVLEPNPPAPTPDAATIVGELVGNDGAADTNGNITARTNAWERGGVDEARIRQQLENQSLDAVQTTDPSIVTSPGAPPAVPQEGETDSQRMQNQVDEGTRQADAAMAEQQAQVHALPGVERVALADVHESVPLSELAAPVATAEAAPAGAQRYVEMNMPPDVQTAFDDIAGGPMQQSQAEAQQQVQQATAERDQQHQAEVQKAETDTAAAQRQADTAQQTQVNAARTQIETKRQQTAEQQQAAVTQLETDAATKRATQQTEFDRQAAEKQREINDEYAQAETDANAEVRRGEAEAEAERQAKEREAEDQSWWEAALDFITDLFDALVSLINDIFDAVRSAINTILTAVRDAVMGLIDAIASALKGLISAFGEILKGLVVALLSDVFPELAQALVEAIDAAVELANRAIDAVAETLKSAVNAIVEALRAGLNALLNVFQGALNAALALARAALTGDWGAFFLQLFEAACRVAGIDPESIYAFIGRAAETIDIIVNDPGQFVSNILDAVMGGFRSFGANFLTHLQTSVIEWLTGQLGGAGITLPERFDLMGVLSLIGQILGLTWENLRQRIVRFVGERGMQVIEFVAGYVQTLIEGGWSALWERIQNDLASLRDMVLEQLKSYIVERIITAAVTRLATMFNPVGALVNLLIAAYQFYTFVRDQMARIARVVGIVADMIGNIARGVLEPAIQAVESVLGGLLTLAIDLLARLIGLGDVGARVREILTSVQNAIWGAIDRLIERVVGMFRGGGAQAAAGPDTRTPQEKQRDLTSGLGDAQGLLTQPNATEENVQSQLPAIQSQYRLTTLSLVLDRQQGQVKIFHVHGEINPSDNTDPTPLGTVTPPRIAVGDYIAFKVTVGRGGRRGVSSRSVAGQQWQPLEVLEVNGPAMTVRNSPGSNTFTTRVLNVAEVINDMDTTMTLYKRINSPAELDDIGVYVERGMLKPEFRGSAAIRRTFYPGDYAANSGTLLTRQKSLARAHTTFSAGQGVGVPWGADAWLCPGFAPQGPHIVEENGEVDHVNPVANHWSNEGGNDTDQDTRRRFNIDIDNHQLLCSLAARCNTRKGSRLPTGGGPITFLDSVGEDFTGPDGRR
jgi:hypothetical protein